MGGQRRRRLPGPATWPSQGSPTRAALRCRPPARPWTLLGQPTPQPRQGQPRPALPPLVPRGRWQACRTSPLPAAEALRRLNPHRARRCRTIRALPSGMDQATSRTPRPEHRQAAGNCWQTRLLHCSRRAPGWQQPGLPTPPFPAQQAWQPRGPGLSRRPGLPTRQRPHCLPQTEPASMPPRRHPPSSLRRPSRRPTCRSG